MGEHAVHLSKAQPTIGLTLYVGSEARSWCGTWPMQLSERSGAVTLPPRSALARPPSGWWSTVTIISTASAEAIMESPGRETVHCWSRVRLSIELAGATTSLQK